METIFGIELKKKRSGANLSLKEVAKLVGCTAPYLRRIEGGASAPTSRIFLEKLAEALMLHGTEQAQFIELSKESQRTIRLPKEAGANGVRIVNRIARCLNKLNDEDMDELEAIIWNANKKVDGDKMSLS